MRYVERDRVEPPSIFASDEARANRQAILYLQRGGQTFAAQSRVERSYDLAGHADVGKALLDLFYGKCAFCETLLNEPLVYRFRPAEGAQPVTDENLAHLYYAWLAEAWQNLYPICRSCVPERPYYFPVASGRRSPVPDTEQLEEFVERSDGRWPFFPIDEAPILLDPCYDRKLWRHLRFYGNGMVVQHRDDRRGRETIEHFRLDRPELTDERRHAFAKGVNRLHEMLAGGRQDHRLVDDREPFAGSLFLYLRTLLAEALSRPPSEDLARLVRQLAQRTDWQDRLVRAHEILSVPPPAGRYKAFYPEVRRTMEPRAPDAVSLRNFKSLERIEFAMPRDESSAESKGSALLILGENAAGKSTILEAIAITLMGPKTRSLLNLKSPKYVLNPRFLGAEEGFDAPDHAWVELRYGADEPQTLTVEPTSPRSSNSHVPEDFADGGASNPLPLFAYGAYRQYLDGQRRWTPHRYVRTMFQTNEPLSNPEAWLKSLPTSRFNMVVRALRAVFSIEGEFEVVERHADTIMVVQRLGDPDNPVIQRTPVGIVSSGFRAVLAMLCDIMEGLMDRRVNPGFQSLETARGLVLIDEIEAHLHPRWKMAIMRGLRQALPQVTFIATSHDPLCLRGMNANEVMVLERIPGEQADTKLPISTQTLVDLPDNQLWTIEQLLTADFFQLRSTSDVEAERRLARMQDKLAGGVKPADDAELQKYLAEISSALPIGDTEVHRLVQEAIATFLAEQRKATAEKLKTLRDKTRDDIVAALRGAV